MADANEYARLMQEQRRGTSAQFPMLPPELQPSGEPLTEEEEEEAMRLAEKMKTRGTLERIQGHGETLGYSLEPISQTFGDALYTGAATGRYLMGEEGAGTDVGIGAAMLASPVVLSPFMLRTISTSLKKVAKSGKGVSANDLRARLGVIDEEATKHLTAIDERLATGTLSPDSADALRKKVADTVRERVGVAEGAYEAGKLGTVTRPFKSEAARRAEHEAAVAAGTATGPYKPLPAWGTGGMMEEAVSQPFKGGGIKPGGQPGKRIETVEDELRAARQITDLSETRLPTAFERKQLIEDGQITTRDPNAPNVPIVGSVDLPGVHPIAETPMRRPLSKVHRAGEIRSGDVLLGKRVMKPAKDAPTPYPEETGEAIMGMPLTKEYTKGAGAASSSRWLGEGTEGMSKSLLQDLSRIAQKEFPLEAPTQRLLDLEQPWLDSGDISRYFDTLTPDQQKRVLEIAKTQPGLGRDIARHEVTVAKAQARAAKPAGKSTPGSRRKMAESVTRRRTAGLTRGEAQAELRGVRKATGTTPMLKKRVAREVTQSDIAKDEFIRDVRGMTSRFSDNEIKFIEQEVKRGTMPADAASLEQFAKMKKGLDIGYDSGTRTYVPRGKRAPSTPTKKPGTSASEGLRKGLPKAKAAPSGTKAKPAVRPEIKRTDY